MTVHQWLDRCVVIVCVCVVGVNVGFYTSLSCGHQSGGDTGEIKSLYEGLSLQPGPRYSTHQHEVFHLQQRDMRL